MITVSESDGIRYLHFGSEWIQGAMRIARPYDLELDYVRQMMAWLLLWSPNDDAHLVQLGLGAAALTKFSWKYFPRARVSVVERDPAVIRAAHQWFALPQSDVRLRIICNDAGRYVARHPASADVLQVDLYDAAARGPVLDSTTFYADCRNALHPTGLLTVNLFGQEAGFERSRRRLLEVFEGRVLTLPETPQGNRVLLALQGPALKIDWPTLRQRAQTLVQYRQLPALSWVAWFKKQRPGRDFVV